MLNHGCHNNTICIPMVLLRWPTICIQMVLLRWPRLNSLKEAYISKYIYIQNSPCNFIKIFLHIGGCCCIISWSFMFYQFAITDISNVLHSLISQHWSSNLTWFRLSTEECFCSQPVYTCIYICMYVCMYVKTH